MKILSLHKLMELSLGLLPIHRTAVDRGFKASRRLLPVFVGKKDFVRRNNLKICRITRPALAVDIEMAERIDDVAKELESDRLRLRRGEHIDNAAANRKCADVFNDGHVRVSERFHLCCDPRGKAIVFAQT